MEGAANAQENDFAFSIDLDDPAMQDIPVKQ